MKTLPALAITVVILAGLLIAGCLTSPSANVTVQPSPVPPPSTVQIPVSTPVTSEPTKVTVPSYRQKLDTRLTELIDPATIPPAGNTLSEIKASMQAQGQLVYAADAYDRFGIPRQSGSTAGDQVYVDIQIKTYANSSVIDPYVTQVSGRDEAFHHAVAWVDVNKLDALTSLDDVRSVSMVIPPVTNKNSGITVVRGQSFGADLTL